MRTLTDQQILTQLHELDPFSRHELLDFMEYLRYRKHPTAKPTAPLPPLRGKYQNRLGSADEFARRKREELELEEAKWTRQ